MHEALALAGGVLAGQRGCQVVGIPKRDRDEREKRRRAMTHTDRVGTTAAWKRCISNGELCEAWFVGGGQCGHPAKECHHLDGRHQSATHRDDYWCSAEAKQCLCKKCHQDITRPIGGARMRLVQAGALPRFDDRYERVR